ncbi:hypothetical protein Tco_1333326 [Tanacetum coccineum]
MDDPNLTMEEYIRFEEEKAHKHRKVFNWQTTTYGKIRVDDDLHNLSSVEAEFPAIVINDANLCAPFGVPFDPKRYYKDGVYSNMLRRPRTKGLNFYTLVLSSIDFADMALPPREQRHRCPVVPVFDFRGLPDLMAEGLSGRMLMEHRDEASVSMFTSRAWRRMLDIRALLVHELILEFFSTFRFGKAILDLDTLGTLQFQLGKARRRISYAADFLGTALSYTLIRDPILRLYHRLIACSIAGRIQPPEKVTVTDLFYLRGMDVGSINVPYLLARYLRLFAVGRKSGAHISGGQFVASLAENFRLLTAEILGGLMVIAPELPIIDMTELLVAMAGAPAVVEDAPIIDEGGQADPTLEQAQ